MAITLRLCQTPEDQDRVYRLRHRVYIGEEGRFSPPDFPDGRMADRFDALPTNRNVLALSADVPIGTVRFTLDSPAGLPADELFDFSSQRRALEGPFGGIGMLAVTRPHRQMPVFFSLIKLIANLSVDHGVRWLFFPLNVEVEGLLRRFGAERVADRFYAPRVRNHIVPMRMSVTGIWEKYRGIFEVLDRFQLNDTYQRKVFKKGDVLIRKGDPSADVFFITRGRVRVTDSAFPRVADEEPILLGPGEYIGELGVLSHTVRSANVAADDEVEVVVIPAGSFLGELETRPALMQEFFQLMFRRTRLFEAVFQ